MAENNGDSVDEKEKKLVEDVFGSDRKCPSCEAIVSSETDMWKHIVSEFGKPANNWSMIGKFREAESLADEIDVEVKGDWVGEDWPQPPTKLEAMSDDKKQIKPDNGLSPIQEVSEPTGEGSSNEGKKQDFVVPAKGVPVPQQWTNSSKLVVDHVCAGSFESAARLLKDQLGIVNIVPFKELFLSVYAQSRATYTALPDLPSLNLHPLRNSKAPNVAMSIPSLVRKLHTAHDLTTIGKFAEAVDMYRNILWNIPLLFVNRAPELLLVRGLVCFLKNYIQGLQMELFRKELPKDTLEGQIRSCELAAYFVHRCSIPAHLVLALRTAVILSFTLKNYKLASLFAGRLMEIAPKTLRACLAEELIQVCEKNPVDKHPIEYSQYIPFSVCAKTYKPIYRGKPEVKCPFCGASYMPQHSGILCTVCTVAEVGSDATGLHIRSNQSC